MRQGASRASSAPPPGPLWWVGLEQYSAPSRAPASPPSAWHAQRIAAAPSGPDLIRRRVTGHQQRRRASRGQRAGRRGAAAGLGRAGAEVACGAAQLLGNGLHAGLDGGAGRSASAAARQPPRATPRAGRSGVHRRWVPGGCYLPFLPQANAAERAGKQPRAPNGQRPTAVRTLRVVSKGWHSGLLNFERRSIDQPIITIPVDGYCNCFNRSRSPRKVRRGGALDTSNALGTGGLDPSGCVVQGQQAPLDFGASFRSAGRRSGVDQQ